MSSIMQAPLRGKAMSASSTDWRRKRSRLHQLEEAHPREINRERRTRAKGHHSDGSGCYWLRLLALVADILAALHQ
jgi:hypothetical protein